MNRGVCLCVIRSNEQSKRDSITDGKDSKSQCVSEEENKKRLVDKKWKERKVKERLKYKNEKNVCKRLKTKKS